MTDESQHLLDEALKLPVADRAVLAAELVASLDADEDPAEVEAAWLREIERRVRCAQTGESKGTDWETVRARIQERLRLRRA